MIDEITPREVAGVPKFLPFAVAILDPLASARVKLNKVLPVGATLIVDVCLKRADEFQISYWRSETSSFVSSENTDCVLAASSKGLITE